VAYPVTHFEINAQDAPATQKFYQDLFGWGIDTNNPESYGMIDTKAQGTGINGGIGASRHGKSWVTFYVETDDPAATLAKAERLGGTRIMEPMDAGGNVVYALFADPEGNVIGLAKMERTQQEKQQQQTRSRSNGNGSAPKARAKATAAKATAKRATARKRTTTAKKSTTAKKTTTRARSKRSRG
jgi:predicted enzyme related to lactoylglutathione lyase